MMLITAVAFGTLLNPLNTSMISVALSRLQEDFRLSFPELSWLISTYYIASAIAQPVMGKLSDLLGRRRVFLLGLALVTLSSILAPLSPTFEWLIGFRIIQAVGSSSMYPAGMGIIRKEITDNQAKTLAVLSVFASTSAAIGPALGGFLLHYGDWPLIFLINFPFIAVSFYLALKVMPKDELPVGRGTVHVDGWGILLFAGAVIGWLFLLLSLRTGGEWRWLPLAVGATLWFYRFEGGRRQPFIDVVFLKQNRQVCLVYLQFILVNVVFYSIMFGLPSYMQNVRQFDSGTVGLIMLSIAGFGIVVSPLAARWIGGAGSSRRPLQFASTVLILGTLMMLTIRETTAPVLLFVNLALMGISNGFQNLGLQTALYENVHPSETGLASGLFMTARFMGTILSSSLLAILFQDGTSTAAIHWMGGVSAVAGCAMLLLSSRLTAPAGGGNGAGARVSRAG